MSYFADSSFRRRAASAILAASLACLALACSRPKGLNKTVIQDAGSDTIVNLAQAWAEEYAKVEPAVSVEVSGGGSGTGISALSSGTVDIANCSRRFEPNEVAQAKKNTGKDPARDHGGVRRIGRVRGQGQPAQRNYHRSVSRHLRRGWEDREVVAAWGETPPAAPTKLFA